MTQRPYHSVTDLRAIGNLIRRAYAVQPNWNTYSFARFDIGEQRRIADICEIRQVCAIRALFGLDKQ